MLKMPALKSLYCGQFTLSTWQLINIWRSLYRLTLSWQMTFLFFFPAVNWLTGGFEVVLQKQFLSVVANLSKSDFFTVN